MVIGFAGKGEWEGIEDNPLVSLTLRFQDGVALRQVFTTPVPQAKAMAALGRIVAQLGAELKIELEDVTPLPGAEPSGYACHICGIIEEAKPDGSLPDGWTGKKYEEGSCFVCSKCQEIQICRVCGCAPAHACETEEGPCYWVEADLCSACAGKAGR